MGWNYLSIPKLQRCTYYKVCNYLSMLGLKLRLVEYDPLNHIHIWQVLSCGDTCQKWIWCTISKQYFDYFVKRKKINKWHCFSNPHMWAGHHLCWLSEVSGTWTWLVLLVVNAINANANFMYGTYCSDIWHQRISIRVPGSWAYFTNRD